MKRLAFWRPIWQGTLYKIPSRCPAATPAIEQYFEKKKLKLRACVLGREGPRQLFIGGSRLFLKLGSETDLPWLSSFLSFRTTSINCDRFVRQLDALETIRPVRRACSFANSTAKDAAVRHSNLRESSRYQRHVSALSKRGDTP